MEYTNTYFHYSKTGSTELVYDGTYKTRLEAEKAYKKFANKVKGVTLHIHNVTQVFPWMGEEIKFNKTRYHVGGEDKKIRYIYTIEEVPTT